MKRVTTIAALLFGTLTAASAAPANFVYTSTGELPAAQTILERENDHDYRGRLFAFAADNGIGLGGPDIVPWRKGQMKNSYPFFNQFKGKLPFVGMAVQEPTLDYVNDKTGKPSTKAEFVEFATDYLGVNAVFWSTQTPWLQE